MRWIFYCEHIEELFFLHKLYDSSSFEIILEVSTLSRFGSLSSDQFLKIAEFCSNNRIYFSLNIDVLPLEREMKQLKELIRTIFIKDNEFFSENAYFQVRVLDLGVLNFLQREFSELLKNKIALDLENGPFNIEGIKELYSHSQNHIKKLVHSSQATKKFLLQAKENFLDLEHEILIFGQILLHFTSNKLLTAKTSFQNQHQNLNLKAEVRSQTGSYENIFNVQQNSLGTFILDSSLLNWFSFLPELKAATFSHFRVDIRNISYELRKKFYLLLFEAGSIPKGDFEKEVCEFISLYNLSRNLIKGHYEGNETDQYFSKLINSNLKVEENNYLGKVLESSPQKYTIISLQNPSVNLSKGDIVFAVDPYGKKSQHKIQNIRSLTLNSQNFVSCGEICLVDYLPRVTVKSNLYIIEENF